MGTAVVIYTRPVVVSAISLRRDMVAYSKGSISTKHSKRDSSMRE